ncbi:MAG: hypothetical protein M5R42_08250 [Rhodocyclaceae bacterium]|nr:hypothetical protein [Rhodocyclaceae bacterium]
MLSARRTEERQLRSTAPMAAPGATRIHHYLKPQGALNAVQRVLDSGLAGECRNTEKVGARIEQATEAELDFRDCSLGDVRDTGLHCRSCQCASQAQALVRLDQQGTANEGCVPREADAKKASVSLAAPEQARILPGAIEQADVLDLRAIGIVSDGGFRVW